MTSTLELELELANKKLAKMTSTVKQLGTKLEDANDSIRHLQSELNYFKSQYTLLKNGMLKTSLTKDEAHALAAIDAKRKEEQNKF